MKIERFDKLNLALEDMPNGKIHRIGNDVVLAEGLNLRCTFPPYFSTELPIILVLTKGTIRGKSNLKPMTMQAPAMTVIMPEHTLQFTEASDDCEGVVIRYSRDFYIELGLRGNFQLRNSFTNQIMIDLEEDSLQMMQLYITTLKTIINQTDNPYQFEAAVSLTRAFFYGVGYYLHKSLQTRQQTTAEQLAEQFTYLVSKHCKQQRSVEYYANELNVSVKHLSNTVRKVQGRTVGSIIEEFVVLEAKALLTTTFLTIAQISDLLSFPDQSTFGKYFKRVAGISPKDFRNNEKS